jgi:glutaminyl-peptide cyclotransferase
LPMKTNSLRLWMRPFALSLLLLTSCNGAPGANGSRVQAPESSQAVESSALVDGERAIGHIREIIALGPRHAGTPGLERTREYIAKKLRSFGLEPRRHDFLAHTPHPDLKQVPMANLSVEIDGPGTKRILLGGHFDGKLIEGVDFKGANDGGSSTALLLEIARYFSFQPPPCDLYIVFFDGEEALVEWNDMDSLYGSKHLAAEIEERGGEETFAAAVIVDMIGDARLRLTDETSSTPWVFDVLKETVARLGYDDVFKGPKSHIQDDHRPLQRIGIPAAVLIDFRFGPRWKSNSYWHTEKDDVDKISSESIETVGHIVIESLEGLLEGPGG